MRRGASWCLLTGPPLYLRCAPTELLHLLDFIKACNYGRRLKTLRGLSPYEYIAKIWMSEPDPFVVNPIHQMPGLNTWDARTRSVVYMAPDRFFGHADAATAEPYGILHKIDPVTTIGP